MATPPKDEPSVVLEASGVEPPKVELSTEDIPSGEVLSVVDLEPTQPKEDPTPHTPSAWAVDLIGCHNHPRSCLCATFFPWCLVSLYISRVEHGADWEDGNRAEEACASCLCYSLACCFAGGYYRNVIREKYGLMDNHSGCFLDTLIHIFCYPCALTQEAQEVYTHAEKVEGQTENYDDVVCNDVWHCFWNFPTGEVDEIYFLV